MRAIVGGICMNAAAFTKDGGKTWGETLITSQHGVAGDAATATDSDGNFYYIHLSNGEQPSGWLDCIVSQKSTDCGKTFMERKVSEKPFFPTTGEFFGDYNNISAHGGVVAAIWTRMDNLVATVWTAVMKHADLAAGR